jgi:hypothetical protein
MNVAPVWHDAPGVLYNHKVFVLQSAFVDPFPWVRFRIMLE